MNQNAKKLTIGINVAFAIVCFISMVTGYGEVRENLDGWHNFTSAHAMIFVLICIVMIGICAVNIKTVLNESLNINNRVLSIVLIAIPLLSRFFVLSLQGNAKSDLSYLLLRISQGFDYTYILLIVFSVISFILMNIKSRSN